MSTAESHVPLAAIILLPSAVLPTRFPSSPTPLGVKAVAQGTDPWALLKPTEHAAYTVSSSWGGQVLGRGSPCTGSERPHLANRGEERRCSLHLPGNTVRWSCPWSPPWAFPEEDRKDLKYFSLEARLIRGRESDETHLSYLMCIQQASLDAAGERGWWPSTECPPSRLGGEAFL